MLVLTLVIAFHVAQLQSQSVAWKSDSALVFLHRSAGMVAPENTIPAFEEAVRQGADGIETDIRKTRDGVFVIYHDDWVLLQRGPSVKIEEMTLAETQQLDVGKRFGPQWRGTRVPLFEDLLRFLKANNMRVYLDIKTPGIYDEVMTRVKKMDCLQLVHATGGQVPKDNYHLRIPWISGWNYTEGGEEDPERMREAIAKAPKTVYGVMCDDARAIVSALNRKPHNRTLIPFVSTVLDQLRTIRTAQPLEIIGKSSNNVIPNRLCEESALSHGSTQTQLKSANILDRRAACVSLSVQPNRSAIDDLLNLARSDPDYTVRQDACWALGSLRDNRAVRVLQVVAQTPYDSKTAAQTDYRDAFLKIAAGCALARLNSDAGRSALKMLLKSPAEYDRSAASVGLAAFGTEKDIPTLIDLVAPRKENDGFASNIVIGYVGRFGVKSIPVYLAALNRDDIAKEAVFGLAALGNKAVPALRSLQGNPAVSEKVEYRAKLALNWIIPSPMYEEKTEHFDKDPGWDAFNNRPDGSTLREVRQDFGWSQTAHAGRKAGEIGGFITPDGAPAYIARKISARSFEDRLSASGVFSCTTGKFHVLVGFFNPGTLNEWRTPNSIALRLLGRGRHFYAYLEYCTSKWRAGGDSPQGFTSKDAATGKNLPVEFAVNGMPHTWSIQYDPSANNGAGAIKATIDDQMAICNLELSHRRDGASFNRFGMLNVVKSVDDGGEVWLDDVEVNGETEHLDNNPGWEEVGNRRTYMSAEVRPRFDFGFSRTQFAGGKSTGELGGLVFRGDGRYRDRMAWYADRLKPLTLEGELRAAGKIALRRGVSDSTTLLGFFNSRTSTDIRDSQDTAIPDDFLGIAIEGPSSEGFFVYPVCRLAGESRSSYGDKSNNRILPNGDSHTFSFQYSSEGPGPLTVKFDSQSISLDLGPLRGADTRFDRFGILTTRIDGNAQRIYFDDLTYTVRQD